MKYIKEYKEIDWEDWDEIQDDYDEFIGHEKFYNFLKENNVLEDFIYYFYSKWSGYERGWRDKKYRKTIKDYLNHFRPYDYIQTSFDWAYVERNSQIPYGTWSYLNAKWKRTLN